MHRFPIDIVDVPWKHNTQYAALQVAVRRHVIGTRTRKEAIMCYLSEELVERLPKKWEKN